MYRFVVTLLPVVIPAVFHFRGNFKLNPGKDKEEENIFLSLCTLHKLSEMVRSTEGYMSVLKWVGS